MVLTDSQCRQIRATIPALESRGEDVITAFYQGLLQGHPELKSYFNQANQENRLQPRAMASLILRFAANVQHTHELIPTMERICQKHASIGVQPHHYEAMEKHLLDAFTGILDPCMTLGAKMAWKNAYWRLANMFISRERQLYKSFAPWTTWRDFTVVNKVHESDDICSFFLQPKDGLPLATYMPGQYVSIRLEVPGRRDKQIRQYALSDAPDQAFYRIDVRRNRGSVEHGSARHCCPFATPRGVVSNHVIDNVMVDDSLELSHPAGSFFLDTSNLEKSPIVLFSTGIGATPMLSILSYVWRHQPERRISWINASSGASPFRAWVEMLSASRTTLRGTFMELPHDFDASLGGSDSGQGRPSIASSGFRENVLFLDHPCTEYFLCGSESIMIQLVAMLESKGVNKSRIRCEFQSVAG